jgi:hypothetical protein
MSYSDYPDEPVATYCPLCDRRYWDWAAHVGNEGHRARDYRQSFWVRFLCWLVRP